METATAAPLALFEHRIANPNPHTISLEELRRSSFLAGIDVVLFFTSSVIATGYWLETRARVRELKHARVDAETLFYRALFMQLLSISNALRALGIVVDAQLRVFFALTHKLAWRRWLDYVLSSLPTLIWSSMLSVLLLYIIEVYHKTQLRKASLLKPTFVFLNAVSYLLYVTFALLTLRLAGPTYQDFRCFAYFELGCLHVVLASGLLTYGTLLWWQLRVRTKQKLKATSAIPSYRLALLASLLPMTELVRMFNDFEYSVGGMPYNLRSGTGSVIVLATAKFLLEWVPSAAILWAFRPRQAVPKASVTEAQRCVDPLLPPGATGSRPEFASSVLA